MSRGALPRADCEYDENLAKNREIYMNFCVIDKQRLHSVHFHAIQMQEKHMNDRFRMNVLIISEAEMGLLIGTLIFPERGCQGE
jgi:hypothetical protein